MANLEGLFIIYLLFMVLIMGVFIFMFWKPLKEAIIWKYFRKNYIRAIIVYKDKVISDKPIKVKGSVDFKDGDRTYTIDHSCVYLTNGTQPTLIYEADDPQPKNVLSELVEEEVKCPDCNHDVLLTFKKPIFPSGEELDNMMMRAKSAGLIKGLMKELPMIIKLLYICIGAGIVAGGLGYLIYQNMPDLIAEKIAPICRSAVQGLILS